MKEAKRINGFYIYSFHHDDWRTGWVPIEDFKYSEPLEGVSLKFYMRLRQSFVEAGWSENGRIEAMGIPPFFVKGGYSQWYELYHVKQSGKGDNGTSWIACEYEIGFFAEKVEVKEKSDDIIAIGL